MLDHLLQFSDYKLTDLLSAAGATIGVIISGTIFLQFLSTKYMELASRYRELTQEYRGGGVGETRHGLLQRELSLYRRRLSMMNWGSWLAAVSLLFFLSAVLSGGFSMVYSSVAAFKVLGTVGLFLGLVIMGVAVLLELIESFLGRHEVRHEAADLDDPAKRGLG